MPKIITKKALARSLKEQMSERPFNKISVEEICEKAEVSRRNFYRYFPDKYALLNWLYYEDYFSMLVYHEDWSVWDYFPAICEYCYRDRDFFKNAFMVEGQNSLRAYSQELMYPLIMHDYGDIFFSEKAADFFISRISDALYDYMQDWLRSEPCTPPDAFAAYVRKSLAVHSKRTWEITSRRCPPIEEMRLREAAVTNF